MVSRQLGLPVVSIAIATQVFPAGDAVARAFYIRPLTATRLAWKLAASVRPHEKIWARFTFLPAFRHFVSVENETCTINWQYYVNTSSFGFEIQHGL